MTANIEPSGQNGESDDPLGDDDGHSRPQPERPLRTFLRELDAHDRPPSLTWFGEVARLSCERRFFHHSPRCLPWFR
jgi:hypothetical protein